MLLAIGESWADALVPNLDIGQPTWFQGLCIFPLFGVEESSVEYLLAEEAVRQGLGSAKEVGDHGSISQIVFENKADVPMLLLEGQEFVGSHQNRVLNTTVLVSAHTTLMIPVSCVEKGRWGDSTQEFSPSHVSPSSVRYVLKSSVHQSLAGGSGHTSNQGAVWDTVRRQQTTLNVRSQSEALNDTYRAAEERLAAFRRKLRYVDEAAGMAVALGSRIVSVDVFDRASTCEQVWPRMVNGLALDALEQEANGFDVHPDADKVTSLLQTARESTWTETKAVGLGQEFRLAFDGHHASALTMDEIPVHLSIMAAR